MPEDTKDKVLRVFEEAFPADLSIREAAKHAKLGPATASTWIKVLEAEGKLEESRRIGNAVLFKLSK